jgi:hypothetical protein
MPHFRTPRRTPAPVALLILLLACVGLAACGSGGSSSTSTTQTTANAAATSTATTTTGTTSSGTTTSGTTTSGTSSSPTPTAPPGRPNAARFGAMRACLAKKGIILPQRTPGARGFLGGAGGGLPKGVTRAQFTEALKSCGGGVGLGGGRFGGGRFGKGRGIYNSPRFHQALARFAACLRQNGVNVGEPDTTGKGPVFDTKGINTGSPQFKAAETKCRSVLFSRPPGATPGAAGAPPG